MDKGHTCARDVREQPAVCVQSIVSRTVQHRLGDEIRDVVHHDGREQGCLS